MTTNLDIDENLLNEAHKIGRKKTKRETVNEALAEYIQRRKQMEFLSLIGTIDVDSSVDYKKERSRHVSSD